MFALDNAPGAAARLFGPFLGVISWLSCIALFELQIVCFGVMPQSKRHVELVRDISTINSIYSSDTMALDGVARHCAGLAHVDRMS